MTTSAPLRTSPTWYFGQPSISVRLPSSSSSHRSALPASIQRFSHAALTSSARAFLSFSCPAASLSVVTVTRHSPLPPSFLLTSALTPASLRSQAASSARLWSVDWKSSTIASLRRYTLYLTAAPLTDMVKLATTLLLVCLGPSQLTLSSSAPAPRLQPACG